MAKKMKLDSLLTANKKNKGIEKMSEYSNQDKEEKKPSTQDLLAKRNLNHETDFRHSSHGEAKHQNEKSASQEKMPAQENETGKRGRKRQYYDPRLKALEMQKISARTKIRMQNLINAKFDGYTPDRMIDFLYDYYMEKGLSKDDRNFLDQLEEAAMQEYKEKPKYQKLFKELEND
ncbi:hypothetical protein P7D31_01030 [Enterococcus dongliensis]|uniref:hypothetical protein n=1 Tax=Enterococcus dongliensis TaxID=2559925 RepID=UPI0028919E05|nr:hypothetical protein [Enterococcus dongliensis]MDT2638698.1 hypothetical protein [Enterococcus dongliensis]MDT2669644.1 hypothetical protein [Enterococcus dongliensis]MDT2674990.1 hypothetical protein [Enterococcus dongliensis]MDT2703584.1 hypothetical protein [Enterococcus dongliensis]